VLHDKDSSLQIFRVQVTFVLMAVSSTKHSWRFFFVTATNIGLFVCLGPHEQFFCYLAALTIPGDRAANLDLCLALMAISSEGSFTCHTYCDTALRFIRSHPKDRHPRSTVGFELSTHGSSDPFVTALTTAPLDLGDLILVFKILDCKDRQDHFAATREDPG
jgi:hypothetical protein